MNYSVKSWARFVIAFILAIFCACDGTNDVTRSPVPADYLPLKKGLSNVYDVTETDYVLGVATTYTYELKTTIVDSFAVTNGGYEYVIYRYKRLPNQTVWNYLDTWSARVDNQQAIVNESNVQFLKFRMPLDNGVEWDGNTYNNKGKDEYTMQDVNISHTYSNLDFEDCITVKQSDNDDFIVFLDQRQEIFSKNVGLIYKETTQLHYCTTNQNCLGKQQVEDGLIYKQTIRSYGVE